MSVRRLLEELDSAELSDWHAYFTAKGDWHQEQRKRVQEDARLMGE